jgi:hypothetical protein
LEEIIDRYTPPTVGWYTRNLPQNLENRPAARTVRSVWDRLQEAERSSGRRERAARTAGGNDET